MKSSVILTVVGASMALCTPQSHAATTNMLQNLDIKLTAYYQMEPTTGSDSVMLNAGKATVSNKDIIAILGVATTNIFSSNAKLMLETEFDSPDERQIIVR